LVSHNQLFFQDPDSEDWLEMAKVYKYVELAEEEAIAESYKRFLAFSVTNVAATQKASLQKFSLKRTFTEKFYGAKYLWDEEGRNQQFMISFGKSHMKSYVESMRSIDTKLVNYVMTWNSPELKYNKLLFIPRTERNFDKCIDALYQTDDSLNNE
jgi:hypothetical protein